MPIYSGVAATDRWRGVSASRPNLVHVAEVPHFFLLKEDGERLLKEDTGRLILQT